MTAVPATATVGIAQWLPVPGEMERNEQTVRAAVADLAARGADLVVLPEMWLTGYDPGQPDGEIVASLPRTGSRGVEYLVTEIRLAQRLHAARQEAGILLTDRRPEAYRL